MPTRPTTRCRCSQLIDSAKDLHLSLWIFISTAWAAKTGSQEIVVRHELSYFADLSARPPLPSSRSTIGKTYLTWLVISGAVPRSYLSKAFVDARFEFYGKTLSGSGNGRAGSAASIVEPRSAKRSASSTWATLPARSQGADGGARRQSA